MLEGRGDDIPVSRCRWTAPGRPAPPSGRSATSPRRAGVGCRDLHPVRPVQLRLPARRDPGEILRRARGWPMRRRASARRRSTCAAFPTCGSRSTSAMEDCTGCGLCVEACPVVPLKSLAMQDKEPLLDAGRARQRVLRRAAGERPRARRLRQRARRAVPRAAVRLSPAPAPAAARRRI